MTKTKSSQKNGWRYARFWLLRLFVVSAVLFAGVVAYLDVQVRQKFEGQKWALPAHVYTRPFEIYLGQKLDEKGLLQELKELGYQSKKRIDHVGSYWASSDFIEIYQRAFVFWDGPQPEQLVSISLRNGVIEDIVVDGESTEIVQLEPRLFGSVSPLSHEDRALLTLEQVPPDLINALIAIEDRQFYSHFGINPLGIVRAMVRNITAGKVVQGGSTLTQQLVKNYYLTSSRTIERKLTEMIMAVLLEVHHSKEDILQAYINEVYLSQAGNRAIHGFALGSAHFFGRPLQELELPELAMMAGIMKGPGYYNPLRKPERATQRRNIVLNAMLEQEFITAEQHRKAKASSLNLIHSGAQLKPQNYPAFQGVVRNNLLNDYQKEDLGNDGLRIHTTLNPRIQSVLEATVSKELANIEANRGIKADSLQIAAVVVRTDNGEIAALIGDRQSKYAGYNRAIEAQRPMGSLIKPFVYLTALEQPEKYSLATALQDKEIRVSQKGSADWLPQNYDGKEHGEVMLMDALARSYNLSTVQLGMQLGVGKVASTVERMGLKKNVSTLPSTLLGSVPMSVVEVAQAYLTLASGGFSMPIKSVRSVISNENEPLTRYSLAIDQVIEPEYTTLINYALQDVVRNGTARSVLSQFNYDYGLAGKTGTTDDYRDSWFAGFSGNYLMVVWVGRDDNKSTGLTGASGAAKVWAKTMAQLPLTRLNLTYTEDMLTQEVVYSGKDDLEPCQNTRQIPFSLKSFPAINLVCAKKNSRIETPKESLLGPSQKKKTKSLFKRLFG